MNAKKARKLIEKESDKIDYKAKQTFLKGLLILSKYDDDIDPSFEHDQIWASGFDTTVTKMTEEEVLEMARNGWFESEDSWSHF